eukprot:2304997-Rhodomonas_salina.2
MSRSHRRHRALEPFAVGAELCRCGRETQDSFVATLAQLVAGGPRASGLLPQMFKMSVKTRLTTNLPQTLESACGWCYYYMEHTSDPSSSSPVDACCLFSPGLDPSSSSPVDACCLLPMLTGGVQSGGGGGGEVTIRGRPHAASKFLQHDPGRDAGNTADAGTTYWSPSVRRSVIRGYPVRKTAINLRQTVPRVHNPHLHRVDLDADPALRCRKVAEREAVEGAAVLLVDVRRASEAARDRQRRDRVGKSRVHALQARARELPHSPVLLPLGACARRLLPASRACVVLLVGVVVVAAAVVVVVFVVGVDVVGGVVVEQCAEVRRSQRCRLAEDHVGVSRHREALSARILPPIRPTRYLRRPPLPQLLQQRLS